MVSVGSCTDNDLHFQGYLMDTTVMGLKAQFPSSSIGDLFNSEWE